MSETKESDKSKVTKFIEKIKKLPSSICHKVWDVAKEDPRRVIHAVKMGTAITLVSLLYLLGPLYKIFGSNAMWAVMTVVLVLEFTAGATLYKGLNRGLGTVCAGGLSLLIELSAAKAGNVYKVVIIGVSIFFVGAGATFVRFIPYIKQNYDYGVIIFLLTFNLITISSFNVKDLLGMARERLYTIGFGSAISLFMCLFILPNWSGQDLEKSTVNKLEALAKSIEACVNDYFEDTEIRDEKSSRYQTYKGYRTVLDSKSTDEAQALFASWEPRHSRRRYPWQRYVELGTTLRHFAYTAVALHGCLESSIQFH
ncbi:uncharacterized protein A4U43_C09F3000 [Asparagus officinalis]|uniref:Aluminum-activated malate transporter n=1 Tax=Asparagus officinalis TaxID=4686 RepID=A0A5P1E6Q4_ASPOF|nr:uncharacterized protein A4U43_C09F3000 [Asparagus officinalis]